MKCLPASKLAVSRGVGVHDWHAEVLVMRAFNRFLLDECARILTEGHTSQVIQRCVNFTTDDGARLGVPFKIKDDVKLHMYCSEAPCTYI
jgi:tRNA-specific adenosine deaminase 1